MKATATRVSLFLGAILALAACGTTASPSASSEASAASEPASQPPELIAVVCQPAPKPFDPNDIDLNGAWAANEGGIYYFRQLGSVVWWNGMSDRDASPMDLGRNWDNVGRGVINGLQIDAEWVDVPRAGVEFLEELGNGTLELAVQDDGTGNIQIVQVSSSTGDFGSRVWTFCSPVEHQVADYVRTYGGEAVRYADILTSDECGYLAAREETVTTTLNTAEAASPEFRVALGYSNAISERQHSLDC